MNAPYLDSENEKHDDASDRVPAAQHQSRTHIWIIAIAGFALAATMLYSMNANSQYQVKANNEMAGISEKLSTLEAQNRAGETRIHGLTEELTSTQQELAAAKTALGKVNNQIRLETQKAKAELNQAISVKADTSAVEAVKQEAVDKFTQVSTDVGGVRTEVGTVKTDLETTRVDLEGTKRQLSDVRDTLSAAVAKNSTELTELRRKGERNYYEFEISGKNAWATVEDVRLQLTKADQKNKKFNVRIMVDDNQLEKKDRTINEPVQFLVGGRNPVRYELVINWVKKDKVGGYLSVPRDKSLSAEVAGIR